MNNAVSNTGREVPRSEVPLPGMIGVGAAAKVQKAAGELKPALQVGKTGGVTVASSVVEPPKAKHLLGDSESRTVSHLDTTEASTSIVPGAAPAVPLPESKQEIQALQQEVVDLKTGIAGLVSMMESMQAALKALQEVANTTSVDEANAGVQAVLPLAEIVADSSSFSSKVRKEAADLLQTVSGGEARGVAVGKGKAVSADVVAQQAKTIEKTKNDYKSTLLWLEGLISTVKVFFKDCETVLDPLPAVGMPLKLFQHLCDVGIDTSKFLRGQADFQKSNKLDKAAEAWRTNQGKTDNKQAQELRAIAKAIKRFQSPRLMQAEAGSVLLRRLAFLGVVVLGGLFTLGVISGAATVAVGGGLFFGVIGVALSFATYRYARKAWRKREVAALEAADKELKAAIAGTNDNPFKGAGRTVRALEKSWMDKMNNKDIDVSTMTGKDKAKAVLQVMHYKRLRIDPNYAVGVLLEKLHDEADQGREKTWEFLKALGFTTEELKKMKDENWKVADIKTVEVDLPEGRTVEVQELPKARVELMQSKLGLIWA